MPVGIKINDLAEALPEKVHNFASDTLMIALSNTAPGSESSNPTSSGNGVLANVTQISYTNYTDDMTVDRTLQSVTSNESGGTYTLDAADITITAAGGQVGPFRYVYLYNDTASGDPLILIMDLEETVTITDGSSITLRWNASGALTLA